MSAQELFSLENKYDVFSFPLSMEEDQELHVLDGHIT
jgi:hypothetical protein